MIDLKTKSLAHIVIQHQQAAAVFEKYQLDFCCRGKRTLQQACDEKNLDVNEVLNELSQRTSPHNNSVTADFEKMTLKQTADYIVEKHHSYVKKELPLILSYMQKLAAKHGERHPEMLKVFELFAAVKEEMEMHMQKEEMILFPRIKEIERMADEGAEIRINQNYIQAPVNIMEQEHDHAGDMMKEINRLTGGFTPPADACTTYRLSFAALQAFETDLHRHIHLENNILFPKALQLFGIPGQYSLN
ncbi:MAG: iron-sulfur cluster repair di-iron protein [Bacteroidetes bacterium]|nr:iron-sulfur cluster repair di-iron protein [Bacteroidota bacterium]